MTEEVIVVNLDLKEVPMFSVRYSVKSLAWTVLLLALCPAIWAADILIVTSDPSQAPGSQDYLLKDFFESMGHQVTYIDDGESEADTEAAAQAADLVFISESVGSGGIKNEITEIQTPMIVSEPWAWDEMGLTNGSGGDEAPVDTTIQIVDPGHFLAAGLSGTVNVLTALSGSLGDARLPKGLAGPKADVIAQATLADGVTYDVLFVYDRGDLLPVAPADGSPQMAADIRIGFFLHHNNQDIMTPEAYQLLAAAVNYALGAQAQARMPIPGSNNPNADATSLSWTAGAGAVSHNVYLGTSPDLTEADLVSQQSETTYVPAEPLTPGQTYYWRVDEVDGGGAVTTGLTWNFTIALLTASNPSVEDGAVYVELDPTLSWTGGFGAATHRVYFGSDRAEVAAATPASAVFQTEQAETIFVPGTLEKGLSYFWRVDEVSADGQTVHTGDVWTFSTIPNIPIYDPNLVGWWKLDDDGVNVATDYSGHDNHGSLFGDNLQWDLGSDGDALSFTGGYNFVELPTNLVTTRRGTVCMWLMGPDDDYLAAIENGNDRRLMAFYGAHESGGDGFGSTLEMHLGIHGNRNARFFMQGPDGGLSLYGSKIEPDAWHHVAVSWDIDGDVTLYFDGQLDGSTAHNGADYPLDVRMRLGAPDSALRFWYGAMDDVRLYDYVLTEAEVQQTMLGDPRLANSPSPAHRAATNLDTTEVSWVAGENAAFHDVYFGTDRNAVALANITNGDGIYKGRQPVDDTTYELPISLEFGGRYYWRIDEVNEGGAISKGRVWEFWVSPNVIIDDFESYSNDSPHKPFQTWLDRWGYTADEFLPGAPGNDTGGQVGYFDISNPDAPYMETKKAAGGRQSLPFLYDNTANTLSRADRIWDSPQDWTQHDVYALQLSLLGTPAAFVQSGDTFTITSSGTDIFNFSDEFRYVYKTLNGDGSMVVRVDSIERTNEWSLAGIMIRTGTDVGDKFAMVCQTAERGVRFRLRDTTYGAVTTDTPVATEDQQAVQAPTYLKLERSGHLFSAYYSADGVTWTPMSWNPQLIPMGPAVLIGLAVCSHNPDAFSTAEFSQVSTTGAVSGDWQLAHLGVDEDNSPDEVFVQVKDDTGHTATVLHPAGDKATLFEDWTQWQIPLTDISAQGVDLSRVKSLHIGVGNPQNPALDGTGLLLIDDVILLRPQQP